MREIITAASAAGVAVALGSPIGGVLFSIEVPFPSLTVFAIFNPCSAGNEPDVSYQDNVEELRMRTSCDIYAVRQCIPSSRPATLTLSF
jgi:hypothetical protein